METFNEDPKPGRLVLPLVLIGMIATTYTFINRVATNNNLELDPVVEEVIEPIETELVEEETTTTTTTTLPDVVVTYLEEISSEKIQSIDLATKVLEANDRWDNEEVTYQEAKDELKRMLSEMGALTKDEIRISIIFGLAVFAWVFRTLLNNIEFLSGLTDAGIAIIAAILLFMTPSASKKGDLLKWEKSKELPWGLLLLFGGGLSLAAQISSTGLGMWIGQSLMVLSTVPPIVLILAVATLIIFLTEITSNVTTTTTFLPVFGALAVAIGILPVSLTVPVCLAASCAFMLPVATPPNAIVYGSNKFTIATMMRAGIALNIIGIIVVTMFAYFLAPVIF